VAALVSLYGLFTDPSTINDHLSLLQGVLPSGASNIAFMLALALHSEIARLVKKVMPRVVLPLAVEREKRSFIQLNLRSLAFTFGALVFVIAALGGIVALALHSEIARLVKKVMPRVVLPLAVMRLT
jgi:membrane protein